MKKLKHWLIKKLGGYVEQTPPAISNDVEKPIQISVTKCTYQEFLQPQKFPNFWRYVVKECAREVAEELIRRNLCEIKITEKIINQKAFIEISCNVIPPERAST